MTRDKTPEDILGAYTDDLLADRRPRLQEDLATSGEAERADLVQLTALVRQVKAAHGEPPPPTEDFLARLDGAVAFEIAARGTHQTPIVPGGRSFLATVTEYLCGWRWQLAGCAVVAVLLVLQIQVVMQVRALQAENRALSARLERLAAPDRMVPLTLPADIGLRLRIEQRIEELEKERSATTGAERRAVERAIQELRALVPSPPAK